jgi:hypothetical protein
MDWANLIQTCLERWRRPPGCRRPGQGLHWIRETKTYLRWCFFGARPSVCAAMRATLVRVLTQRPFSGCEGPSQRPLPWPRGFAQLVTCREHAVLRMGNFTPLIPMQAYDQIQAFDSSRSKPSAFSLIEPGRRFSRGRAGPFSGAAQVTRGRWGAGRSTPW